jgi:hypothetical protein
MIPFKVPATTIAALTIILSLVNLVGLVKVEMTKPPSHLLLLFAAFLAIISAIIFLKIQTIKK